LERPQVDSFGEEREEEEAHLSVASDRRGAPCSGGAKARWCGVLLVSSQRTEKGEKRTEGREGWWRRNGGRKARVRRGKKRY
jgi:hypothetical protein